MDKKAYNVAADMMVWAQKVGRVLETVYRELARMKPGMGEMKAEVDEALADLVSVKRSVDGLYGAARAEQIEHETAFLSSESVKVSIEFPTQEAMDKYLKDHPDADKSKHKVVKQDSKDMGTHPMNLMRQRKNEERLNEIGKALKKDPKDLTNKEISDYNSKKGSMVAAELAAMAKELVAVGPSVSVDELMKYEDGRMTEDEVIDLFQRLVKNGMAWQLQGAYGRMAMQLIQQGLITRH